MPDIFDEISSTKRKQDIFDELDIPESAEEEPKLGSGPPTLAERFIPAFALNRLLQQNFQADPLAQAKAGGAGVLDALNRGVEAAQGTLADAATAQAQVGYEQLRRMGMPRGPMTRREAEIVQFWDDYQKAAQQKGQEISDALKLAQEGYTADVPQLQGSFTERLKQNPIKTLTEGVAGAAPNLAATVGAGVLGGPLAAALVGGSLEYGSTYGGDIEAGATPEEARLSASLYAPGAAVLESYGAGNITNALLGKAAKGFVVRMTESVIREGGTESLQRLYQEVAGRMAGARKQAWSEGWGEAFDQALEEGVYGALLGTGGAISGPSRAQKQPQAEPTQAGPPSDRAQKINLPPEVQSGVEETIAKAEVENVFQRAAQKAAQAEGEEVAGPYYKEPEPVAPELDDAQRRNSIAILRDAIATEEDPEVRAEYEKRLAALEAPAAKTETAEEPAAIPYQNALKAAHGLEPVNAASGAERGVLVPPDSPARAQILEERPWFYRVVTNPEEVAALERGESPPMPTTDHGANDTAAWGTLSMTEAADLAHAKAKVYGKALVVKMPMSALPAGTLEVANGTREWIGVRGGATWVSPQILTEVDAGGARDYVSTYGGPRNAPGRPGQAANIGTATLPPAQPSTGNLPANGGVLPSGTPAPLPGGPTGPEVPNARRPPGGVAPTIQPTTRSPETGAVASTVTPEGQAILDALPKIQTRADFVQAAVKAGVSKDVAEAAGALVDAFVTTWFKKKAVANLTLSKPQLYQRMLAGVIQGDQRYAQQAQREGRVIRGAFTPLDDGRALIQIFKNANTSTLPHELGHLFRQNLRKVDRALADHASNWVGATTDEWTRDQEERFARGFERWLREGKAPTKDLGEVFAQFKTWLREVYTAIKGTSIDMELTPEIRGVFKAMLGGPVIWKEGLELSERDLTALEGVKAEVEEGEAGYRVANEREGQGSTQDWMGVPSTFPEWFKNKGYTKAEAVNAIDRALEGKPLTEKSADMVLDLLRGYQAEQEAKYGVLYQEQRKGGEAPWGFEEGLYGPVPRKAPQGREKGAKSKVSGGQLFEGATSDLFGEPEQRIKPTTLFQTDGSEWTEPSETEGFVKGLAGKYNIAGIGSDLARTIGRQSAPIRLATSRMSEILKEHGSQLRQRGYQGKEGLLRFLGEVLTSPDKIVKGNSGSLIFVVSDRLNKISVVRLAPGQAGDFYSILSAFVVDPRYVDKRPVLWERAHTVQRGPRKTPPGAISGQRTEPTATVGPEEGEVKPGEKLGREWAYHNTTQEALTAIRADGLTGGSFSNSPIEFGGDVWIAVRRSDLPAAQTHQYGQAEGIEPQWEAGTDEGGFPIYRTIPPEKIVQVTKGGRVLRVLSKSKPLFQEGAESLDLLPPGTPKGTPEEAHAFMKATGLDFQGLRQLAREGRSKFLRASIGKNLPSGTAIKTLRFVEDWNRKEAGWNAEQARQRRAEAARIEREQQPPQDWNKPEGKLLRGFRIPGQGGQEPADVLKNLGPVAEQLTQKVVKAHANRLRYAAEWTDDMALAVKRMSREERKWFREKFVWAYEDQEEIPESMPNVRAFAEAWLNANEAAGRLGEQLHVRVNDPRYIYPDQPGRQLALEQLLLMVRSTPVADADGQMRMAVTLDAKAGQGQEVRERIGNYLKDYGVSKAQLLQDLNGYEYSKRTFKGREFQSRDPETYVPHHFSKEVLEALRAQTGRVWEAVKREALARGMDPALLVKLAQGDTLVTRHYGSLENARVGDLPRTITLDDGTVVKVLEDDPAMLFSHLNRMARRLALIEQFGQDSAQYAQALAEEVSRASAGVVDPQVFSNLVLSMWTQLSGQGPTDNFSRLYPRLRWLFDAAVAAAATAQLSAAVVPNLLGGHLPSTVRMGVVPTLKGFFHAWTTRAKNEEAEIRMLGGLLQDVERQMMLYEDLGAKTLKGVRWPLRLTGFTLANLKINQAIAWSMARQNLTAMLDAMKRKDESFLRRHWGWSKDSAHRYLVNELRFSEDDVKRMVESGPTPEDMGRAVQMEKEIENAMNESPATRPPAVNNMFFKLILAYSTYVRKFAKTTAYTLNEAKHGNVAPLVRHFVAGQITGAMIRAVRDWLKDREREDENVFEWLLNNFLEAGSLGLWGTVVELFKTPGTITAGKSLKNVTTPAVAEFHTTVLDGLAQSVRDSVAGEEVKLRPFVDAVTRSVPAVNIAKAQGQKVGAFGKERQKVDLARRLSKMVYTTQGANSKGDLHEMLDPKPGRENTVKRLMDRWEKLGYSKPELLRLIQEERER